MAEALKVEDTLCILDLTLSVQTLCPKSITPNLPACNKGDWNHLISGMFSTETVYPVSLYPIASTVNQFECGSWTLLKHKILLHKFINQTPTVK